MLRDPSHVFVHEMFEAQAKRTPGAVAVTSESEQVTYSALNARANRLAHHLRDLGVGPASLVGLCLERSVDMMVAVLGILKAGAAYVPLDPAYPRARLRFFMEDTGARLLVTHRGISASLLLHGGTTVVDLERDRDAIDAQRAENPERLATPEDLAYVIFTSGSTGRPKGVMIPHRALANYTQTAVEAYAISEGDRVLQFASISFDASAEEIYPCFTVGGTLVLRTELMLESVSTFVRKCAAFGVTVLSLPTSYFHELAAGLGSDIAALPSSLRLVIIGGERRCPRACPPGRSTSGHGRGSSTPMDRPRRPSSR